MRALLATAVERSPWHRGRIGRLDIASLSDGDIAALPVMTKTDLMDNFDAIVTDPRLSRQLCEDHLDQNPGDHLLDEFQIVASGSSSGLRGVFVYGWEAWTTCCASNIRSAPREWSLDPSLARVRGVIAVDAGPGSLRDPPGAAGRFSASHSSRSATRADRTTASVPSTVQ